MMMGLRLSRGVGFEHFAARCGRPLEAAYGPILRDLAARGLIAQGEGRVRLTARGRMLGNRVFERFV
jgi:oxygen-independent coproporphyrinogen-3 oxidase